MVGENTGDNVCRAPVMIDSWWAASWTPTQDGTEQMSYCVCLCVNRMHKTQLKQTEGEEDENKILFIVNVSFIKVFSSTFPSLVQHFTLRLVNAPAHVVSLN